MVAVLSIKESRPPSYSNLAQMFSCKSTGVYDHQSMPAIGRTAEELWDLFSVALGDIERE